MSVIVEVDDEAKILCAHIQVGVFSASLCMCVCVEVIQSSLACLSGCATG